MDPDTRRWVATGNTQGGFCSRYRAYILMALTTAVTVVVGVYLWEYREQYFRLGTQNFGPGDGKWLVESPEVHGLDPDALDVAASRVGSTLQQRDCLVVVKDGVIVHETYYNGATKDSMNFLASVGKTAVSLVVGAAVRLGKIDLDTPLVDYGVVAPTPRNTPSSSLGEGGEGGGGGIRGLRMRRNGGGGGGGGGGGLGDSSSSEGRKANAFDWGEHWSRVTTRHLLAQTTGWGAAEVGSTFNYDSNGVVLGAISQLLRAVTGQSPAKWAREHLTAPLGVPAFFDHDEIHGDISAAGGQMATCRDAARFGQLIANDGRWLAADGSVRTLVDPWFVKEMTNPSYPEANQQYGYLTWLHPGKNPDGRPRVPPQTTTTSGAGAGGDTARTGGGDATTASASATANGVADADAPGVKMSEWSDYRCCDNSWRCPVSTEEASGGGAALGLWGSTATAAAALAGEEEDEEIDASSPGGTVGAGAFLGEDGPDFPLAMAMGWLGKFVIAAPEVNLVVVSMGNTWGVAKECPVHLLEPQPPKKAAAAAAALGKDMFAAEESPMKNANATDATTTRAAAAAAAADKRVIGYNEIVVVRALWAAIGDAVTPSTTAGIGGGHRSSQFARMEATGGGAGGADGVGGISDGTGGGGGGGGGGLIEVELPEDESERHSAWQSLQAADVAGSYVDAEEAARTSTAMKAAEESRRAAAAADDDDARVREAAQQLTAAIGNPVGGGGGKAATTATTATATATGKEGKGHTGSCYCYCPPYNDVGQCVNMRNVPKASCDAPELLSSARGFCPSLGVLTECKSGEAEAATGGSAQLTTTFEVPARRFEVLKQLTIDPDASEFSCSATSQCTTPSSSPSSGGGESGSGSGSGGAGSFLGASSSSSSNGGRGGGGGGGGNAAFLCEPLSFYSCVWDPAPCVEDSPYYAVRNATVGDASAAGVLGGGSDRLILSEPSVTSYLGLRAAGGGSHAEDELGSGIRVIHQTRAVVAGLMLMATVAAAVAVRVARAPRVDGDDDGDGDGWGGDGEGGGSGGREEVVHADLESAMLAKHARGGLSDGGGAYGATDVQRQLLFSGSAAGGGDDAAGGDDEYDEDDNPFK